MNALYIFFIVLIGLAVGSFVNVCIYRIPSQQSIVFPGSSCPKCGKVIKWYDLIPVLSYIFLLGKCRNCKEHISFKYPLVEILTAVLFVILYLSFGFGIRFLIYCAIVSILIMIFFIDLEHMIIPDGLNLIIGLLGITLNIIYPFNGSYKTTLLSMLYGFLLGGGLFFILACFGAMGGGDIKLMAALGLVFGWKVLIPLMFVSFVLGGIIGIALLAFKVKTMKDMIPFGPYIVASSIIMIFYGMGIFEWYLSKLLY